MPVAHLQRLEGLLAEQVVRVRDPCRQAGQVVCFHRVGVLEQLTEIGFPARVERLYARVRLVDPSVKRKCQQMAHRQRVAAGQALQGSCEQLDGVAKTPCRDECVCQVADGTRIVRRQFHTALQACQRRREITLGGEYQGGIVE